MNSFSPLRGSALLLRWLIVVVLLSLVLAPVAPVAAGSSTAPEPAYSLLSDRKAGDNLAVGGAEEFLIAGSFSPTASLSQARTSHVAIRLLDGRVLVAGGGSDLRTAEIYNPTTETWSPTGSLTYGRYGQSAVLLSNGKVMVIGGVSANVCSGPPVSNSAEIYDPATGVWSLTSSMTASRHQALAMVLADGRVLVAGGGNRCGSVYTSAEIYNPATGTWSSTGSMNVAREIVRGVRLPDGRVLVAGGTGSYPFASLASSEIYNPATGSWTVTGGMNQPRIWPGQGGLVVLPTGLVLAVGGYLRYCDVGTCAPSVTLSSAELYDTATGLWTLTASLAHPRLNPETTLLLSGQVLITGGADSGSGTVFDSAELYDPATGTFAVVPATMTNTRQEHSATRLTDGRVLIAGGYQDAGSIKLSSAEIYAETPPISFDEEFDSSSLDPAWQVIEFTGARVYGYTEPANHVSLTANPGHLRYYLDRMTHYDGFLNNYQTTRGYHSCCDHDPGLELHRLFSGDAWTLDVKASYYMPFSNGRYEDLRVYFGDGGPGTYYLDAMRWRDGPWPSGTPETQPLLFMLRHKTGPNLPDYETLDAIFGPPSPSDTYYFRVERNRGSLTVKWSADGSAWTTAFTRDLGMQLTGLSQRVVLTGLSWYTPAGSYADYDYIRLQPTDGENIAYNPTQTGFPHPLESDTGWGGGSYPWEMLDGHTYYTDTWAHGLAFTGGVPGYIEPCGWRQATVDFGVMKTFDKMRIYHHGDVHIPTIYRVEYWNGSAWQVINATSTLREDLRVPPPGVYGWGAVPTEHVFSPVTGSKARFVLNNCNIEHGWIYEFQVFAASAPSNGTVQGVAFDDIDGNGVRNGSEPGLEGAVVALVQGGATILTATSSASGDYQFTAVAPGEYQLVETTPPPGYSPSPNAPQSLNVVAGATLTVDLGHQAVPSDPSIFRVRVSNVKARSFTVSWITDQQTTGEVRFGVNPATLDRTAQDDRGAGVSDDTHHATLGGLDPGTTYYFDVVSGSAVGNNGGSHYTATTGPELPPPASDTVYGRVFKLDGTTLAEGAIVYVKARQADGQGSSGDSAVLSTLVSGSGGYWYLNLAEARTQNLAGYFSYSAAGDQTAIEVEGAADCRASVSVNTNGDSPVPDLMLDCVQEATISFQPGWNLPALPLEPETSYLAQSWLDELNAQGGGCTEIDRWRNGGWDAHVNGLPFNNFPIDLGQGYFAKCSLASAWTLSGWSLAAGVPTTLQPGWNLVSVPYPESGYMAQSVLDGINAQGGNCTEIDRWRNGGWDAHLNGLPFNNFSIAPDQGYFVKCSQASTFVPGSPTGQESKWAWEAPALAPSLQGAADPAIDTVEVVNRRDVAVSIVWRTDRPSDGQVEYGETPDLGAVAGDDRGVDSVSTLHFSTLTNLKPQTTYYFRVRSGKTVADSEGQLFSISTLATGAPSEPATAFGQVRNADGTPAMGALVIARSADDQDESFAPLAALVDGWGFWSLDLSSMTCEAVGVSLQATGPSGEQAQAVFAPCKDQEAPALVLGKE